MHGRTPLAFSLHLAQQDCGKRGKQSFPSSFPNSVWERGGKIGQSPERGHRPPPVFKRRQPTRHQGSNRGGCDHAKKRGSQACAAPPLVKGPTLPTSRPPPHLHKPRSTHPVLLPLPIRHRCSLLKTGKSGGRVWSKRPPPDPTRLSNLPGAFFQAIRQTIAASIPRHDQPNAALSPTGS